MTITVFLSALLLAMALGLPIAYALLVSGVALMVHMGNFDPQILAQNTIEGANSFPLLAVPFFMLAGEIMNSGGLSRRIVNVAMAAVGHVRGGIGYVTVVAACVLSALSGSALTDAAALATLLVFHKELDLYAFVGLIMLLGVVKKNAIMMIDFAIEAQRVDGHTAREAIYQGCTLRFRPIMMTTMAALFGTLPIALGYGEGGDARQPLGLCVVGGLLVSQVMTLYITPVVYLYMEALTARFRKKSAPAGTPA